MENHLYLYPNLVSVRKATCTQKALAEKLGISQQEVSRYERGEIKAPINYIIDVANICNVSIDFILGHNTETSNMLSSNDFEIMEIFCKLNKVNKLRIVERAQTLLDLQNAKTAPDI